MRVRAGGEERAQIRATPKAHALSCVRDMPEKKKARAYSQNGREDAIYRNLVSHKK